MAAPVVKPSRVVVVIDGVFVANIKPATAIHKVQRTMRMFMRCTPDGCLAPPLLERFIALRG
jgi:hypothetical protein